MPGQDSPELAAQIHKSQPSVAIAIILANRQKEIIERATAIGAVFLPKPLSESALAAPEGRTERKTLSQLFAPGQQSLALYSFIYRLDRERPCPGCAHMLDSLVGVARHASQRINLVDVAKSPPSRLLAFAQERRWPPPNFSIDRGQHLRS